jgi:DNA-binding GntR family transcriptional regulator
MVKLDLVVGNSVGPSRSDQPLIGKLSLADQLARSLIGQISKGSLKRGEQLPTEAELCKIHGVSRITVRRALDLLQKSDLIDRIAGKGTFVTGRSDIVGWQLDSIQDLIEFTTETRTAAPTILQ